MSISTSEYLRALSITVHGTLFQRLGMGHLGPIDAVGDPGSVRGLTAVVTGPTAGIGRATAAALARRGAHVVLACRSAERGARLVRELEGEHAARGLPPPSLEVRLLDLASLSSVRAFCEAFRESNVSKDGATTASGRPLRRAAAAAAAAAASPAKSAGVPAIIRPAHVLVCNAGVFNMGVRARRETAEGGLEEHLACNHLGHFLLAVLMLPSLREGTRELQARAAAAAAGGANDEEGPPRLLPRARVVSVSSAMHHYGASLGRDAADRADPQLKERPGIYTTDRAYGRSKLAQLLFTAELRRRLAAEARAGAGGGAKKGGGGKGASSSPPPPPAVDAVALHPGMVVTEVVRSLPAAVGAAYRAIMGRLLLSPDEGARASVAAATASRGFGGDDGSGWYLDANALPVAPCPVAECPETAAWLWRWSAETVGLRPEEDLLPAAAADE